jgi:hypothetical protein
MILGDSMRFTTLTIALGCLLAALPVMAADNVAALRAALGQMPESVLATNDPMPIAYLDVEAMSRAENGALSESALRRVTIARSIRPMDTLMYGGRNFTEKAGVAFEDVSYFAGYGQPPKRLSYWGLADPKAASMLFDALPARKFKPVQADPGMLANGEPRAVNFEIRDGENPWLGELGQSSYVITRGHAVVQASAPEDFKPITEMTRSVADNVAVEIALTGLETAPAAKDATIVQAMLVTPFFGLAAVDPSSVFIGEPADLEATRKKIEAMVAESAKGIPPYLTGIITDVQLSDRAALLVSLAYADCTSAETAVQTIQKRWHKAMSSDTFDMTGQAVPTANGGCAAVVSFTIAAKGNKALALAFARYMGRDFNFLQIGNPE